MPRPSIIAQALVLLVLGYAVVAGEPGVLIGVVGVALCAWDLARRASAVLPTISGSGSAVAVRAPRLRGGAPCAGP